MHNNTNSNEMSTISHGISHAQVDVLEAAFGKQIPTDRELTEEEYRANYEIPEWVQLLRRTVKNNS
jgi:hypothetical protein